MTQEAVGQELFLTQQRIGQINDKALKKLAHLKNTISDNATPEK